MRSAFSRRPFHPAQRERLPGGAAPAGAPPPPDVNPPLLLSATINAAGTLLLLVYDEPLNNGSVPLPAAYALTGTASAVTGVSVIGATVPLTLSPPVLSTDVVALGYTAGASPVEDLAGNDAANLVGQAVTNNSTVSGGDTTPPAFVSAAINAAGTLLTLTYNEALNAGSVPTVTLTGALLAAASGAATIVGSTVRQTLSPAVALDETGLTVTTSGAPVQDAAGNSAAALVGQAVDNSGNLHAFVPSDVPGLVAWFDLQDPSSFTHSGGFLTGLTNKASGIIWNTGVMPAFLATAIGGALPGLDFNGTTHCIHSTEAAVVAAFADSNAITAMLVVQPDNADRTERFLCAASSAQALNRTKHFGKSSTGAGNYVTGAVNTAGTVVSSISTGVPITTPQVFESFASTTQDTMRINGGAPDPNLFAFACGALAPDRVGIACRPASTITDFLDGKIGEICLYASNLAANIRSRIRVYLGARWLITVTPGGV